MMREKALERRGLWRIGLVVSLIAALCCAAEGRIAYVDDDAPPGGDGSSWDAAYRYLSDALAEADTGGGRIRMTASATVDANDISEIRVAQGVYRPDRSVAAPEGTRNRRMSFRLVSGVVVAGGYAGIGAVDPNARDVQLYETVLSGDLDSNDVFIDKPCDMIWAASRWDNSYHVVTTDRVDVTGVLDGFRVTGGNAYEKAFNGYLPNNNNRGGGVFISKGVPRLVACRIVRNSAEEVGGGIYCTMGSPELIDCVIEENGASTGAGFFLSDGRAFVSRCVFLENQADHFGFGQGGGIWSASSNVTISMCEFIGNRARYDGGGFLGGGGEVRLVDSVFRGNASGFDGGGMYCTAMDEVIVRRCRFSGNAVRVDLLGVGGAIYAYHCDNIEIANCVVVGNRAKVAGGLGCYGKTSATIDTSTFVDNRVEVAGSQIRSVAKAVVSNCILRGEEPVTDLGVEVSFTNVQGGWQGAGDIDSDPCFADAGYWDANGTYEDRSDDIWIDGDYHLKSQAGRWSECDGRWVRDEVTSSCIDAGDSMSAIGLEGFPNGGRVNMGAYGSTAEASRSYFGGPVCEMVFAGDINGDCKVDFRDFAITAQNWTTETNK